MKEKEGERGKGFERRERDRRIPSRQSRTEKETERYLQVTPQEMAG